MKIITFNANGIRSAEKKGFFNWLAEQNADAVCIQETKAHPEQLTESAFYPFPVNEYFSAEKKGYSGVALYLKQQPLEIIKGIGWADIDKEGRFIEAKFPNYSIISLYVHSGSSGDERQLLKEDFLKRFFEYLQKRKNENLIICGDFNIAHTEKDIKNWKGNLKNSGFLPHERQWLTDLFQNGYADAFRKVNQEEIYSWWSNRGQARANNVGWRIDYQIISQSLLEKVKSASIYRETLFSDHAPVILEYDL